MVVLTSPSAMGPEPLRTELSRSANFAVAGIREMSVVEWEEDSSHKAEFISESTKMSGPPSSMGQTRRKTSSLSEDDYLSYHHHLNHPPMTNISTDNI